MSTETPTTPQPVPEVNGENILKIFDLSEQDGQPEQNNPYWEDFLIPNTKCTMSLPTPELDSSDRTAEGLDVIFDYWHWRLRIMFVQKKYRVELEYPKNPNNSLSRTLPETLDWLETQMDKASDVRGWKQFNPIIKKLIEGLRQYA